MKLSKSPFVHIYKSLIGSINLGIRLGTITIYKDRSESVISLKIEASTLGMENGFN